MSKRPIIGVTFDSEEGGYSPYPWYALRENYCSAISRVGGIPFPLIHELSLLEEYLHLIDGLVVTGGDFDIDPQLFGASYCHDSIKTKPKRTQFELEMTKKSLEKNKPVLGICGGMQLLNVIMGGTLIQHIPEEVPDSLKHSQSNPRHEPSHKVDIIKETLLHRIVKDDSMLVNSSHHQAIKIPGRDVLINAVAPDGIVEGIEIKQYSFCLGVQWHPEYFISPKDTSIFKALYDATLTSR